MAGKGKPFRELLKQLGILISPGVYDGYSTRLTAAAKFKTGAISGAGVSESRMGWADRGVLPFEVNLDTARCLADCADFNGLFFRNAVNFACPLLECPGVVEVFGEGNIAEVDVLAARVRNVTRGSERLAKPLLEQLLAINNAGGIYSLLEKEASIASKAAAW
jgi:hypothetical protein